MSSNIEKLKKNMKLSDRFQTFRILTQTKEPIVFRKIAPLKLKNFQSGP